MTLPRVQPSLRRAALAAAGIALIAAACSSGSSATPTAPASSTPAASATAAATTAAPSATATASARASSEAETYEVKLAAAGYLTGEDGKTLYVFDNDKSGATSSACTSGQCTSNWPAFTLDAGEQVKADSGVSGTLVAVTLANGTRQVAYNGRLLYYFKGDAAAGQATGDGVGGIWHVAKP